jgi:DNA mismatch endonuclease (patch repair protein)
MVNSGQSQNNASIYTLDLFHPLLSDVVGDSSLTTLRQTSRHALPERQAAQIDARGRVRHESQRNRGGGEIPRSNSDSDEPTGPEQQQSLGHEVADVRSAHVTIRVPPSPGPSHRSANMRANRRRDTGPERAVRVLLHARGLRYRVDLPINVGGIRPVRPDVAFTRLRICCFIDGCWWHGCPQHGRRRTNTNDAYWTAKIGRNIERDAEQRAALEQSGWTVLRYWEHEQPERVAKAIADAVDRIRSSRLEPAG